MEHYTHCPNTVSQRGEPWLHGQRQRDRTSIALVGFAAASRQMRRTSLRRDAYCLSYLLGFLTWNYLLPEYGIVLGAGCLTREYGRGVARHGPGRCFTVHPSKDRGSYAEGASVVEAETKKVANGSAPLLTGAAPFARLCTASITCTLLLRCRARRVDNDEL